MRPGSFAPGPMNQLTDLQMRLSALERRATGGSGVSSVFGTPSVRTMQPGFPAELTSAWNASTGYSWKRLDLSGVSLINPSVQLTGDKAVTPDEDTSLASGARGWLEPDRDATGWLFVSAGGGSSLTTYESSSSAGYLMSGATNVWENTSITYTIPAAGTYSLEVNTSALICVSALGGGFIGGRMFGRLYDQTNSAALTGTVEILVSTQVANIDNWQQVCFRKILTVSGATVIRIEALLEAGPTFVTPRTGINPAGGQFPQTTWRTIKTA